MRYTWRINVTVWCNYKSTVEATNMQKLISEKDCFVQAAAALDKKNSERCEVFLLCGGICLQNYLPTTHVGGLLLT
jgi:hypothetical protein